MQLGLAKVRLARRIRRDLRSNPLKLTAPNVLQILSLRRCRRRFVQINRNLITLPDLFSHTPRHPDAIFNGHTVNRNEGHHIGRAHSRMRPLVHIQVDQLRGSPHSANRRLLNRVSLTHQRDHAAVVVRVHLAIQQVNTINLHRGDNGVNLSPVASLRKIRHTLYKRRHK